MSARIAVLASRVRAEEKRIMARLDARHVEFTHVDTRRWWTANDHGPADWDVVLNREVSYWRALYGARSLEAQGSRVLNRADAVEVCGDKWRTALALTAAGVPTPRTLLAATPQAALDALDVLGYPAVVKPLVGSWGRLVSPVRDREGATVVTEHIAALPGAQSHVLCVQEMIDKPGRDIRVAVLDGQVLGAAYRASAAWRTNVSLGADTWACPVTPDLAKLALAAAAAVGADLAGVDVVEDTTGRLSVLEVNHGLEFTGLQAALGDDVDIAGLIADHLIELSVRVS